MPSGNTDKRFDGPGPDAQYLRALSEGRFELQRCADCASVNFPPALVCRACGSPRLTWKVSSGAGIVYSTTTVRDRAGDYNVAIVELEGGARMMSRVDGVAPDAVRIGQRVMARIVQGTVQASVQVEEPFVVFTPEGGVAR